MEIVLNFYLYIFISIHSSAPFYSSIVGLSQILTILNISIDVFFELIFVSQTGYFNHYKADCTLVFWEFNDPALFKMNQPF